MLRPRIPAVLVLLSLTVLLGFGQVINATLSGTVSDVTGALIPGVSVTATQTATGVVSTAVTNESGTYRFPSLQPGPYQVAAELPGFQSQTFQVALGTAQQIRQNFTLQVGGVAQQVEVSVAADQLLTAQSSSVGGALAQTQVVDLPLVGRNVMDIATRIVPGVSGDGAANTTFAGITVTGAGNVGIQMDGVSMNAGRHAHGLATPLSINPDMVDEVRVVVAAVDAEGRGSAQVQMRTRSGTNQFHGGVTWNVRNSALNANTWASNRQGIEPIWYNRHQYTASVGGPIVRNKTFFFALFDGQDGAQRQNVDALVLTDLARQGTFRFFPGVNNGHAETTVSGTGNSRIAPVVDLVGNARDWTQIPGATGPVQSFSVFGDSLNPGDPFRRQIDRTGFITKLLGYMPRANAFNGQGDGLNTAVHRWVRRTVAGAAGFTGENADAFQRRQINVKIDHHFNTNHRLTGTWIRENRYSDNMPLSSPWPTGFDGEIQEYPKLMSAQLTSTLSPTLLNEFRFGYRVTSLYYLPGFHVTKNPDKAKEAYDFLTKINGVPVAQSPTLFANHVLNAGGNGYSGNTSPLFTYTDTLSWSKGTHAIKTGVEFRLASSQGYAASLMPRLVGGAGDVPVTGIDRITGMLPTNITLAQNLLLFMSGSVSTVSQTFQTREPTDTEFLDFNELYFQDNPKNRYGVMREWHQPEINFFIKDDWRVTPSFTLNLGMRYDLFRVPYQVSVSGQNWTAGLLGGNEAVFGYSGRSIANWMSGGTPQKGELTQSVLIGKGTPYPEQGIWPSDRNNFAPAVGFAWSPRWGGQDKTTIRGGYQIAYQLPGNSISWISVDTGGIGLSYGANDAGDGTFRDFSNSIVPPPLNQKPWVGTIPVTARSPGLSLFAPDYTTPYVQTFTLGVTRSIASNMTLDVKYVGTRGVKLHSTMNLNEPDFRNNGLLQALEITRAGGDAPMFDQMLRGLNIGSGVIGTTISGSEALRRHSSFRTNIANGNFAAVANTLNTTNIGTVQPRGQIIGGGTMRSSGLFPENFIVVNPQFSSITYRNNSDSSNYHSLQTQVNMRPTRGMTFQGTYTWSRSMGRGGGVDTAGGFSGDYRDLLNMRADYRRQASHRLHDFRSYGSFELPFGPGKIIGGGSSGWVARVIGGWQVGTILNLTSGAPLNVGGVTTLYNLGTPDIVGAFPREGNVVWPLTEGNAFGNYFGQQYQRVPDPACAGVASVLTVWCTNTALADANGNIVLRNAAPGQLGSLGLATIEGPGSWDLDANLQKSVRIAESRNLIFRVDARNVFNHPNPGNPNLNINSGTFGEINSKTGNRTLAAQVRFEF
jgi:hypothetical protein